MRNVRGLIGLLIVSLFASPAAAGLTPLPGPADARIRTVKYDPNEVIEIAGTLNYQMTVEFGEGERLENVSIGDGVAWQVTPNRKASLLFIKPLEAAPPTNMTVVTNLRRYAFELTVRRVRPIKGDRSVIYGLRFDYPPVPPAPITTQPPIEAKPAPPQVVNAAYSYDGSSKGLPERVFDDGKSTYFQFGPDSDYPAIFTFDAARGDKDAKGEAVVNITLRDGYLVIDQVARGFILRRGGEITRLYNDGFHDPVPGPLSPKPRPKTGWFNP